MASEQVWCKALVLVAACLAAACSPPDGRTSEPNLPIARSEEHALSEGAHMDETVALAAGEVHTLKVELRQGELLDAVVHQQGIDVTLRLRGPDGSMLHQVDSPTGRHGDENLIWHADRSGTHLIEVQGAVGAPVAGSYRWRQLAKRPPQVDDGDLLQADADMRLGQTKLRGQDWEEAEARYEASRLVWQRLGRSRREAEALRMLGVVRYRRGDYAAARKAWLDVLVRYRKDQDPRQHTIEHDLGQLALRQGETARAIEWLEQARPGFEERNEGRGLVQVWTGLGNAWRMRGELQRALDAFEVASRHSHDLDQLDVEASLLTDRAALLLELDRGTDARETYRQALDRFQLLENVKGVAATWRGIADASLRLGELPAAEQAARKSLEVLGEEGQDRDLAAAWSAIGNIQRKRGEFRAARESLDRALALVRKTNSRRAEANIRAARAQVDVEAGQPARGLAGFDTAAALFVASGARAGEAMAMARGAEALRRLGRHREAWARLEPALSAIEDIRRRTHRQDFRLSYFGSRQDYYALGFGLLLELETRFPGEGYDARALALHERRLAREVLNALALEGGSTAPLPPTTLDEEGRVGAEIARHARTADAGPDARLDGKIEQLHRLRARPNVHNADSGLIDLATVQKQLLDDDTTALVYVLGTDMSHLLEIDRRDLRVHALPAEAMLVNAASSLIDLLQHTRKRSERSREPRARELGRLLLGPVAERLKGQRLLIVADGVLRRLPFAALRHPVEPARWVIESHEVTMASSLSAFAAQREAEAHRPPRPGVVIFADPVFDATDPRLDPPHAGAALDGSQDPDLVRRAARGLGMASLPRLRGTGREADMVEALWPAKAQVVRGFDATRERLLTQPWREVGVLYIASHALAHPRPELSGLVLSLVDRSGIPQPGFVTSLDIARLRLPVSLVVLSACETGVGRSQRGEGQVGLAWSFEQAGAARLAVSLWQVSDRRTARLMRAFLEGYRRSGRVPEALRQAQLEVISDPDAQPFDWAGFVAFGDWRETKIDEGALR